MEADTAIPSLMRMKRQLALAMAVLVLGAQIAFAHTELAGLEALALDSIPELPQPPEADAGVWTCWYEGTPIHRLPIVAKHAIVNSARAGKTLEIETVESSPFGVQWLRVKGTKEAERFWIPLAYCRRVAPANAKPGNLPIGREHVGPHDGLPVDYKPNDMIRLSQRYCYNDMPQLLRKDAAESCTKMLDAARREAQMRILVLSAFRSARTQAWLCKRKIDSAGIRQGSVARPGHSEHQLGTTVDLVGDEGHRLLDAQFGDTREGRWLRANCERFGFVQTYTPERTKRDGVAFEPWHFRYVGRENLRQFQARNERTTIHR